MDRFLLSLTVVVVGLFVGACAAPAMPEQVVAWELPAQPAASATSVDIDVVGGGCAADDEVLGQVSVEETTETVTITATIRKPRVSGSGVCPDIGRLHRASVELDAPLGDRRLLDGSTGAPR